MCDVLLRSTPGILVNGKKQKTTTARTQLNTPTPSNNRVFKQSFTDAARGLEDTFDVNERSNTSTGKSTDGDLHD